MPIEPLKPTQRYDFACTTTTEIVTRDTLDTLSLEQLGCKDKNTLTENVTKITHQWRNNAEICEKLNKHLDGTVLTDDDIDLILPESVSDTFAQLESNALLVATAIYTLLNQDKVGTNTRPTSLPDALFNKIQERLTEVNTQLTKTQALALVEIKKQWDDSGKKIENIEKQEKNVHTQQLNKQLNVFKTEYSKKLREYIHRDCITHIIEEHIKSNPDNKETASQKIKQQIITTLKQPKIKSELDQQLQRTNAHHAHNNDEWHIIETTDPITTQSLMLRRDEDTSHNKTNKNSDEPNAVYDATVPIHSSVLPNQLAIRTPSLQVYLESDSGPEKAEEVKKCLDHYVGKYNLKNRKHPLYYNLYTSLHDSEYDKRMQSSQTATCQATIDGIHAYNKAATNEAATVVGVGAAADPQLIYLNNVPTNGWGYKGKDISGLSGTPLEAFLMTRMATFHMLAKGIDPTKPKTVISKIDAFYQDLYTKFLGQYENAEGTRSFAGYLRANDIQKGMPIYNLVTDNENLIKYLGTSKEEIAFPTKNPKDQLVGKPLLEFIPILEGFTRISYANIKEKDNLKDLTAPITSHPPPAHINNRLVLIRRVLAKAVLTGDYLTLLEKDERIGCLIQALQECQQDTCFMGCKSANERTQWVQSMKHNLLLNDNLNDELDNYLNGMSDIRALSEAVSETLNANHALAGDPIKIIAQDTIGDESKLTTGKAGLTSSTNTALSPTIITYVAGGPNQVHTWKGGGIQFRSNKLRPLIEQMISHTNSITLNVSSKTPAKSFVSPEFLKGNITIGDNTTIKISQKLRESSDIAVTFQESHNEYIISEKNNGQYSCRTDSGKQTNSDESLLEAYQALAVTLCTKYYTDNPPHTLEFNIDRLNHDYLTINGEQKSVLAIIKQTCNKTIQEIEKSKGITKEDQCTPKITGAKPPPPPIKQPPTPPRPPSR